MHINKRRLLKSTRWFNNIKIQHLPLYFKYKIFPNLSSKIFDESTLITSRSLSRYYVIKMLNEEIILRSSVFFFGLRTFITCAMGWLNSQSIFVMHELLNLYFYFTKKKIEPKNLFYRKNSQHWYVVSHIMHSIWHKWCQNRLVGKWMERDEEK